MSSRAPHLTLVILLTSLLAEARAQPFNVAPAYRVDGGTEYSSARSLAVADLNGDGEQDLVVAMPTSPSVAVLLGDGRGRFAAPTNYAVGAYVSAAEVVVADFNGDGRPDAAVGTVNGIAFLAGDGQGGFGPPIFSPPGTQISSIATGDFDGDSKPDLAATGLSGQEGPAALTILRGAGDGTFRVAARYSPGGSVWASLTVSDVNGDGNPDVVVPLFFSGRVSIFLGTGRGTLRAPVSYGVGVGPVSATVGDFNGDGKPDLAVANYSYAPSVSILLGTGTGSFLPALNYGSEFVTAPGFVTNGDFDGDGALDLAVTGPNEVSILLGDGRGGFAAPMEHGVGAGPAFVATGDFNDDGKPDLAVVNALSNDVSILLGTGMGAFRAPTIDRAGSGPQSVAIGDFNSDGRPDFAVANFLSADVSILLQTEAGTFVKRADHPVGKDPLSVAAGDFNRDGALDLAVADAGSNEVSILFGDGRGGFATPFNYRVGTAPMSLAVADLNGDGTLDLVVVDSSSHDVSVLLGDGRGGFATRSYPVGSFESYLRSVALGDFNRDGFVDLAVTDMQGVWILLGTGTGAFGHGTSYAGRGASVATADLNGDGKLDLALAEIAPDTGTGVVSILLGDGDGGFGAPVSYGGGGATEHSVCYSLAVADFDGDGRADVAVADNELASVWVFPGTAAGTLGAPVHVGVGLHPVFIAVGDLNSDGSPDLAVAHEYAYGNNDAWALLNTSRLGTDRAEVWLSATNYATSETSGQAVITVLRTGPTAGTATVDYATSDGTAVAGRDYTGTRGTLTFGPGVGSRTFAVPILNEAATEGDLALLLSLANATGAALGTPSTAVLSIRDDDVEPAFQLGAASYSVLQGGKVVVTVRRLGPTTTPATVAYATSPGTAVGGVNYVSTAGTLSFSPGVKSRTFTVQSLRETADEGNTTVLLGLSSPSGGPGLGTPCVAELTILDRDVAGTVQFRSAAYPVKESGEQATITVTRSRGTASGVTVDYATSDGTGRAGTDYSATSGTLSFGAGVASRTFAVPIADNGPKGDQTVNLKLSRAGGGAVLGARQTAVLIIRTGQQQLAFSKAKYTLKETGNLATIAVRRSGLAAGTATVDFASSDGTAVAGRDYTATHGTLTFGPGVVNRVLTVPVSDDALLEGNETVNLTLSNPGGGAFLGAQQTAVLTIVTDDPMLRFSAMAYAARENGGRAVITVQRLAPTRPAVTVDYRTSDGTAVAGVDYAAVSGTLSFGPGVASKTFAVPILHDPAVVSGRTLNLTLTNPKGGALLGTPGAATLTITNRDLGGSVQFRMSDFSSGEAGQAATITVTRAGGLAADVSVDYATSDGTAVAGTNYRSSSGTLVFGQGETSKSFMVEVLDDGVSSGNKSVTLTLSNPRAGAALGAQAIATLWIVADP